MKFYSLFFVTLCMLVTNAFSQTAYIQVSGEPGLSVYLNNRYKGKTTVEYKGYIIENVTPGKNLIKIEKEGFASFEETITVKPGEVFAYKVKPFTKHIVQISEQGNTAQTEKKEIIETGKLIIQSVPIEIKITMPDIEGIQNSPKTKDEWLADKIPAGNYKISFSYNQKIINKTIEISGNETTNVFVNMLSGDFKSKNSLDAKKQKERLEYEKHRIVSHFVDSISKEYKFKVRMKENAFKNYNTEAGNVMTYKNLNDISRNSPETDYTFYGNNKKSSSNGPTYISFHPKSKELLAYSYNIISGKGKQQEVLEMYKKVFAQIENTIPKEFIRYNDTDIAVYYPKMNIDVRYKYFLSAKQEYGSFSIFFLVIDR